MNSMYRLSLPVVSCAFAMTLVCCADSHDAPPGRFAFREPLTSDIVRLEVTNPTGLGQAEDLLRTGQQRWALGTPRRGDGGFNAPWAWHLDPSTVLFAELTIEACQTRASAVAADLDYWLAFGQVCISGIVERREP